MTARAPDNAYIQEQGKGEWADWLTSRCDPYEHLSGPFYCRTDKNGTMQTAFRVENKHLNNSGFVHGGCLMAFADFSLFWIAYEETRDFPAVTASFNSEFIDSAKEGDMLEATGEVVRATASLIFVRGLISNAGSPILNFSAILKKVRRA
jgi:uncharacterized protein (TIGR00369 family)